MKIYEILTEGVAGPKNCWPGYRKTGTQPGTGKNKGKRVNDCEKIKKEDVAVEGSMDDSAIWNRYGHYNAQDLIGEFPNLSPKDAQTIVNFAEYGWTSVPNRQEYRDEVVQRVKAAMGQQGTAEDLQQEFDMIESIIEQIADHHDIDVDLVWEDLSSLTDDELYVFAVTSEPINEDWQKANKRDKTDGMSKKAVNAYRRENPGSKLKTAVTTKPSKLKKGSKASKRRSSYCSRSAGQQKMHNISCSKTPDKAICKARRRWNC
jgi:hypothetical protein